MTISFVASSPTKVEAKTNDIVAMISPEKEVVPLGKVISVFFCNEISVIDVR